MAQVDSENTTAMPAVSTRRRFLSQAAGVAAGATAAVVATKAAALPAGDGELLKLEEQIFEQHELATAHDDEIVRLDAIWRPESERLYKEALSREVQDGAYLTPEERWALVTDMPEAKEHDRLCRLQDVHAAKMDALVKQMWAITRVKTPEGRRAKVLVALRLLPDAWREHDENADYGVLETRQILIEFIGGEPGEQMRDQFA